MRSTKTADSETGKIHKDDPKRATQLNRKIHKDDPKRATQLNRVYIHLLLNQIALMIPYTQRTNMLFTMKRFGGSAEKV